VRRNRSVLYPMIQVSYEYDNFLAIEQKLIAEGRLQATWQQHHATPSRARHANQARGPVP
jgi:hypothetical protein